MLMWMMLLSVLMGMLLLLLLLMMMMMMMMMMSIMVMIAIMAIMVIMVIVMLMMSGAMTMLVIMQILSMMFCPCWTIRFWMDALMDILMNGQTDIDIQMDRCKDCYLFLIRHRLNHPHRLQLRTLHINVLRILCACFWRCWLAWPQQHDVTGEPSFVVNPLEDMFCFSGICLHLFDVDVDIEYTYIIILKYQYIYILYLYVNLHIHIFIYM